MLNDLIKIGLSEKEAKVYLAALELGKASVQDIAKKAGINRTTTYVIITALEKKGLVKTLKVGKRQQFLAENPGLILEILKREKQKIEEKEKEIREILPELKSIYNISPDRPKIFFYEGPEVYKKIGDDILESNAKEILEIYNADFVKNVFPENETKLFFKERSKRGIRLKTLYTRSDGKFKNRLELAEERFIDEKMFPVSSDIFIYANRVGLASLKGKIIGVIIESDEISETMKTLFGLAWRGAEKFVEGKEEEELEEGT